MEDFRSFKKVFERIFFFLFSLFFISCSSTNKSDSYKYAYLYDNLKFEMEKIQRPTFPNNKVNLRDFGAVSDGETLNTQAFAAAMEKLAQKGGGTLVVPSGVWYTGPIVFESNINLHLEKGALILFSSNFDLYPLVETSFEGLETHRCQSPISGRSLENIAITGQGSINGSGQDWRPLKKEKVPENFWKNKLKSGGVVLNNNVWFPSAGALKGHTMSDMNVPNGDLTEDQWLEIKDYLRPVMVSFIDCRNILLEGVLFENSPAWNIHPLMCENLIVDNISVRNPGFSQNGDGLDIESCTNVIIVDSSFDVGDDAICVKSGKDEDGRRRGIPTSNVLIDNCKVFQGHGGFVVGSEMSGGAKNIVVANCQFLGTDVGLRFKSTRGRGGVVENIFIENINMFDIATEALLFDLYYGGKSAVEVLEEGDEKPKETVIPSVDETTPAFKNIYIENLVCRNARRAMYFNGLPEMNIENINVKNVSITSKIGAELSESTNIYFEKVDITPEQGPAFILTDVTNFEGAELNYPAGLKAAVQISGDKTKDIKLPESIKEEVILRK